ncbi:MAG: transcriptional repressor LexA [Candidatus Magasanikbacteria bacterium]|nr:transcriptional repressor LexA [Candidatus Magasanikbacteria bacterium]
MKPASSLTKKQAELLSALVNFFKMNDRVPTYRELAEELGLKSPATIAEHVIALSEKGFLKKVGQRIELTIKAFQRGSGVRLPLMGLITAGEPIEALETRETMVVPAHMVVDGMNSYVLKVRGDSMIEEGIFDGDFVVVERSNRPHDGDVVVALLDNTYATLKKFYREKTRIRLQPANKRLKPIFVKDCIIQGVVRGVIRTFRTQNAF